MIEHMSGFYISKLRVASESTHAELSFVRGANLITGASDTGKSYVFSALNHVLGRSEPPRPVIESTGFTELYLEIGLFSNDSKITLHRTINSTAISVWRAELSNLSGAAVERYTTSGSIDNVKHISYFLLSLMGLEGRRLLFNKTKGVTRNLSIKNITGLTFVSETDIIKEGSPFYYTEQFTDRTLQQSLVSLIMTGNDYSDVVEAEDQSKKESRIGGKLEFIDHQI